MLVSSPSSCYVSLTLLLSGSCWLLFWRAQHSMPSSYPSHCQIFLLFSCLAPDSCRCFGVASYISCSSPVSATSPFSFFSGWWRSTHKCETPPPAVQMLTFWCSCMDVCFFTSKNILMDDSPKIHPKPLDGHLVAGCSVAHKSRPLHVNRFSLIWSKMPNKGKDFCLTIMCLKSEHL